MEKPHQRMWLLFSSTLIFLGTAAFSCCIAAEFKKAKSKDMKLDGSLCSIGRSPAFGLGVAALVLLSIMQIAGTTAAATRLCSVPKNSKRKQFIPTTLFVLSWISFGLTAILLGTGTSMNEEQSYGKGWMNGECYVVKDGVYVGAAILAATTLLLLVALALLTLKREFTHVQGQTKR